MKTSAFKTFLGCLFLAFGCEQNTEVQLTNYNEPPVGQWTLRALSINGIDFETIEWDFEPWPVVTEGNSYDIGTRWFYYQADGTYEFRRNTIASFVLGNGLNFQPSFGYWKFDEERMIMTHNERETYATNYNVLSLSDTLFIREYERTVQFSYDTTLIPIGETVVYREELVPRNR